MGLAEKSLNEGDYRVALALLNAVRDHFQNKAAWRAMVGYAHFKLDQPEPALENLQLAVRLDPSNEDYYLELAEFLGANNAVSTVVIALESAAKSLPGSIKIETALGVAYLMIADTRKAETMLKNVVKRHPAFEIAYKLLADCYLREHDWGALKSISGVLRERNPKNAAGWYYGALAEYETLDSHAAESLERIHRYTRTAIRLDPEDWRSQVLAGKLLLREKRPMEAATAFRKATELNPAEPSAYYLLATTLRDLRSTEESKAAFEAFSRVQSEEKARKFRSLVVEILKQ
jgi:tetratricopeptide (TPR) repeat protein